MSCGKTMKFERAPGFQGAHFLPWRLEQIMRGFAASSQRDEMMRARDLMIKTSKMVLGQLTWLLSLDVLNY